MFGIGTTEFIVIALVLLIFVGPKHLPELLARASQIIRQVQNASRDLRNQIDVEIRDISNAKDEISKEMVDNANRIYGAIEDVDDEVTDFKEELKKTGQELENEIEKDNSLNKNNVKNIRDLTTQNNKI